MAPCGRVVCDVLCTDPRMSLDPFNHSFLPPSHQRCFSRRRQLQRVYSPSTSVYSDEHQGPYSARSHTLNYRSAGKHSVCRQYDHAGKLSSST